MSTFLQSRNYLIAGVQILMGGSSIMKLGQIDSFDYKIEFLMTSSF